MLAEFPSVEIQASIRTYAANDLIEGKGGRIEVEHEVTG
jgi:hypothetical protein